jgi:hypothetical protein
MQAAPNLFTFHSCPTIQRSIPLPSSALISKTTPLRNLLSKLGKIDGLWLSILLGIAAFLFITGGKILIPTYTDWLMCNGDDPAQHYLGWVFFRDAPLLQWPLGANPNYGMDISGGIAHTDSIPLFALLFKPLSPLLPEVFQYTGIWIFVSFIIQSIFAWKLLSLFTKDKWLPLIGTAFFLIAPIWLFRVGIHNSSFGQWAIVAGLYFYFRKKFSFSHWTLLILCISLVNTYITMMTALVFMADLAQRIILKQNGILKSLSCLMGSFAITLAALYAAGSLMVKSGLNGGGFGTYRMNLLAIVDPDAEWSRILNDIGGGSGDYEGFNYLGLGMILLAIPALFILAQKPRTFLKFRLLPLFILSVALFLYAISNCVALGPKELHTFPLPERLEFFANSVRCSGRFFWPVFYLIYAAILYLLFNNLRRLAAIITCCVMLTVQIADFSDVWARMHEMFLTKYVWHSPMESPMWEDLGRTYKKLIFVLPLTDESALTWLPRADYAAKHHMAVNSGYFSRVERGKIVKSQGKLTTEMFNGDFHEDSLYIFGDDKLWDIATSRATDADACGVLDGYRIFAPGFMKDGTHRLDSFAKASPDASITLSDENNRIQFRKGAGTRSLIRGWSNPEPWGTWSDSDTACVFVRLKSIPQGAIELQIEGCSFVNNLHPSQQIEVFVNDDRVGILTYSNKKNDSVQRIHIPHYLAADNNGALLIMFHSPDGISPKELGVGDDPRVLGIGLKSITIEPVK